MDNQEMTCKWNKRNSKGRARLPGGGWRPSWRRDGDEAGGGAGGGLEAGLEAGTY